MTTWQPTIVDDLDIKILDILRRDSRTSLTDIGKILGVSRFAVKRRVNKLYSAGILLGSTIAVDPLLLGYRLTVFFEFKTNPHEPWLAESVESMDWCEVLDGVAGDYSLFVRFKFRSDDEFRSALRNIDRLMSKSAFKRYRFVNVIYTYKESGVAFSDKGFREVKLDQLDIMILRLLQGYYERVNEPLSPTTTEISRLLNETGLSISQPSVYRRITRLEEEGVIRRHTILISHRKLGQRVKFVLKIKANPSGSDAFARNVLTPLDEIVDLYRTGEDYGLLAVVRVKSVDDYNGFLVRLYAFEDVLDTFSVIVLEERKGH